MRMSKTGALLMTVVFAHCLLSACPIQAGSTFVPFVTQDALQSFWGPEDDFEEVLSGNQTSLFTGQFLNAFSTPNSVTVSYDATTNSTIVEFAGPPIARNLTTYYTFGFAVDDVTPTPGGPTTNPMKTEGYWTPEPPRLPGQIPTVNTAGQYLSASKQAVITISNDPGTLSLYGVGYLVTNAPFSLTSLNRTALRPVHSSPPGLPMAPHSQPAKVPRTQFQGSVSASTLLSSPTCSSAAPQRATLTRD